MRIEGLHATATIEQGVHIADPLRFNTELLQDIGVYLAADRRYAQ
jgi:hypothetical protein